MSPNSLTLSLLLLLLLFFHVTVHQSHATALALEARDPQEDDVTTTESTSVGLRSFHVSSSLPSASDPEIPPTAIAHSLRPRSVRCSRGGGSHVSRVIPVEVPYGNDMVVEKKSEMEEKIKKKKKEKKLKRNSDSDSDSDSDDEEEEKEKRMRKMKWKKKKEGSGGFLNWISKLMAF